MLKIYYLLTQKDMEELRALRNKQNSVKINEKADILTKKIDEIKDRDSQQPTVQNNSDDSDNGEEENDFGPSIDFKDTWVILIYILTLYLPRY